MPFNCRRKYKIPIYRFSKINIADNSYVQAAVGIFDTGNGMREMTVVSELILIGEI